MTTETPEEPAQTAPQPQKFNLAQPRGKLKTGMPVDGMGILSGLPKGGKSAIVASIPDCPVLELERGGADRLDGWIQEIPDLATFRQALQAVVEDPRAKAVAIDSIDILNDWFEAEIAEKFGLESISERKEGINSFEVWKLLRARYEGLIGYLKRSGKLAIIVAHSREPKIDADGKIVIPAGISIPGKLGGYLAAEADFIGNVYKKQVGNATQYFVSFQGGSLGTWGSRVEELEDKTIVLPRNGQWAAITAVCNGKTPEAPKTSTPKEDKKAAEKKPAAKAKGGK